MYVTTLKKMKGDKNMFLAQMYIQNGLNMFNKAMKNLTKGIDLMDGRVEFNKERIRKLENETSDLEGSIAENKKILENISKLIKVD